jgi:hypothetical protein
MVSVDQVALGRLIPLEGTHPKAHDLSGSLVSLEEMQRKKCHQADDHRHIIGIHANRAGR